METITNTIRYRPLSAIKLNEAGSIIIFDALKSEDQFVREIVKRALDQSNYSSFSKQLDPLFKSGYKIRPTRILSNLAVTLSEPENRSRLADILLQDEEAFQSVCCDSYIHDNGFRKIVLAKSSNFKVRWHIFEVHGDKIPQENIHDHRWPFASVCLEGNLVCKLYSESSTSEDKYNHYTYSPVTDGNYSVSPNGVVCLAESNEIEIDCGSGYYLPEFTKHRVINKSGTRVITLIVTGIPWKETCNLYSKKKFQEEHISVEELNEFDIRAALIELKFL